MHCVGHRGCSSYPQINTLTLWSSKIRVKRDTQHKPGHHMIISHGELVTDTVGAVWRVGVPKASWEKGLEQVKGESKKASLRKQHLWWNLIVAYALVKLTTEEE